MQPKLFCNGNTDIQVGSKVLLVWGSQNGDVMVIYVRGGMKLECFSYKALYLVL